MQFTEFVKFVKFPRDHISSEKLHQWLDSYARKPDPEQMPPDLNVSLLEDYDFDMLKQLFDELDIEGEGIVRRQKLIDKLREDERCQHLLEKPAILLRKYNKRLSLGKLIQQFDYEARDENTEWVSWNEFFYYLKTYERKAPTRATEERMCEMRK